MVLFDNGDTEEFLLFVRNFNVNLAASGTLATGANIQYLRTLVRGEAIPQADLLSAYLEGTNHLNVENIILGFTLYFSSVN